MTAVLSLGSNLGDPRRQLSAGLDVIGQQLPVVAVSAVYRTAPVGVTQQPPFHNVVALVRTDDAEVALRAAHAAEDTIGRLRSRRWGPRTLDVDVIDVNRQRAADPRLTLPHPRAHERGFVLVPWLSLDPEAELVGWGQVRSLVQRLDVEDVVAEPRPLPWPHR